MVFTLQFINNYDKTTVKELLEKHLLIPRKVRHFLRTRKHVLIDGQAVNWQTPVSKGSHISLTFEDDDYPQKSLAAGNPDLVQILFEDEHLIIVNKPEGMKTHGNAPDEIALLNHVSSYAGYTCYVVHRLDMETSGAILFAKHPIILPILNRLLEDKLIQREYWALTQQPFPVKQAVYNQAIGRHRHDRRKRTVDPIKGKSATTIITRLKHFDKHSLVKCHLKTGRTHQIRVHLSHNGFPIVGDPLYNHQRGPRLMLHAYQLSFTHPFTLETIKVQAKSHSFETILHRL